MQLHSSKLRLFLGQDISITLVINVAHCRRRTDALRVKLRSQVNILLSSKYVFLREGGETAYYISPKSFLIMFSYLLTEQLWGLSLIFDWLGH